MKLLLFMVCGCFVLSANSLNISSLIIQPGDTITDKRDGKKYPIIKLSHLYWFKKNLNYKTTGSQWYNNDSLNGEIYGRLYTKEAAQNACPVGWRLPNLQDWKIIDSIIKKDSMYAIMDITYWDNFKKSKNTSGFSLLPGGYKETKKEFIYLHISGALWFHDRANPKNNYHLHVHSNGTLNNYYFHNHKGVKDREFSVRCVCEEK